MPIAKYLFRKFENTLFNLILITIPLIYFLYLNPLRDWIENYDQELWISYNALLYLSNLSQELFDAPHFLQIFLLSIFYKILNIFDFLNIKSINDLNTGDLNSNLQKIIFFTRIYGLILGTFFILIIKYLLNKFIFQNNKSSLFLTLSLTFSGGYLIHIQQHRVEIITLISFLIAIISLINFIQNQDKKFLFFFTFFFILSIITKIQIMFYAPLLFLITLFFQKKINYQDEGLFKFSFYKFVILLSIFLISIIFRSEQIQSTLFLITYLSIINILFYFFIFKLFTKKFSAIYHLNLFLLISFIIISLMVLLIPSASKELFYPFFRISKIRGHLIDELRGCCDLLVWLKFFLIYFFKNIKTVFENLLLINYINFLFFEIILLLVVFRKFLNSRIIILTIIILLAFLGLKLIESFRALTNYYQIYYGWFLLIPIAKIIIKLKDKKLKFFIFFITLILSILTTIKDGFFHYNYASDEIKSKNQFYYNRICAEKDFLPMSFWPYWLNKIKYENIKIYCNW